MLDKIKSSNSSGLASGPSVLNAIAGICLGITVTYLIVFSREIIRGEHLLDTDFLGNLLWLGVGVLLYGMYEAYGKIEPGK